MASRVGWHDALFSCWLILINREMGKVNRLPVHHFLMPQVGGAIPYRLTVNWRLVFNRRCFRRHLNCCFSAGQFLCEVWPH